MRLEAIFRRFGRNNNPDLGQDELGNLLVTDGLPKYARLSAAGKLFAVDMSGGTAKAPVVAMPVASPEWGLYNASETQTLVLLHISAMVSEGTTGLGLGIVAAAAIGKQTLVTADYSGTIKTCLNGSQDKPDVWLANNPTLVGGTPAWVALGDNPVGNVAQVAVGNTVRGEANGMFSARPGGGMVAFEVVGLTGTSALYDVTAVFAMIDLNR